MMDLVIVGDQAWTREEWERRARPRPLTPEQRERKRAYARAYYWRNRDRINARNREWMARHRKPSMRVVKTPVRLVGSLHSLACLGPTKATGCRCKKIRMYSGPG